MTEIDRYFRTKQYGGYSNCLDRGDGWTVPNCVGMAWGMFFMERGVKDFSKRPTGDANTIYEACKKYGSGFWVSKAVKEHSILCFNIGKCGHVVYCMSKINGYYFCIESNYSGTPTNGKFIRTFMTKNPESLYKNYQGCVYNLTNK